MEQQRPFLSELLQQFPILENHSVLQTIKCNEGNHGFYVCFENQCQNYPFMCNNRQCPCRRTHVKCIRNQVEHFIQNLYQKVVNLKTLIQHHNKTIDNFVQEIVKYSNEMKALFKAQISKKWKELSFSPQELDILVKIQQSNLINVKGTDFFKVYSEMKLKKKDESNFNETKQTEEMEFRWKNIETKVLDEFKSIQATWRQNQIQKFLYASNRLKKSSIATTAKQYQIICGFFNKRIKLELLYKASQNQFKVAKFHQLCDKIPNTLVLIQTQFNKKIGGFSPLKWAKSQHMQYLPDSSNQTFTFSLTHNEKLIQSDLTSGIINCPNYGPDFGCKHFEEVCICQNANINQNSCGKYNVSFVHPNYALQNRQNYERFTGNSNNSSKFRTKQWQVWRVIFQQ